MSDGQGHHSDGNTSLSSPKKRSRTTAQDLPEIEVDVSLPEPPSKRAKRALKKGKPLPPKPSSDDEREERKKRKGKGSGAGAGPTEGVDGKEEKATQYGIWIGNLPFTVTRPQLFQWLVDSSGGSITEADITRVNLPTSGRKQQRRPPPRNPSGEAEEAEENNKAEEESEQKPSPPNKGFAYVDFATYEAKIAAVALSETELDGRRLLIKDSKSFEGRPQPGQQSSAQAGAGDAATGNANGASNSRNSNTAADTLGSTKIFVGNLGFDTTEKDLQWQFSPCGPIAWAKVATFPDNVEKCRGYGWVQFGMRSKSRKSDGNRNEDEADQDYTDQDAENQKDHQNTDIPEGASYAEMAAVAAASAVKGFVRIRETVDTEEDFLAEAGEAEDQPRAPRTKIRKWWVNQLKGRPLKIQLAEDDQQRYRKRFGKDRPRDYSKNEDGSNGSNRQPREKGHYQQRENNSRRPRQEKFVQEEPAVVERTEASNKPYNLQDLSIAQRTGAVTKSLGKKTVFE